MTPFLLFIKLLPKYLSRFFSYFGETSIKMKAHRAAQRQQNLLRCITAVLLGRAARLSICILQYLLVHHFITGGIARLKPLEQPAVSLEGKEALMENYLQHIRNLGQHGFATLKWQF